MLTLFSLPKAFEGRTGIIQDNAISSWARLGAGCEIVLFGDETGIAQAAARHGARHESTIVRNADGTPLLGDTFAQMDNIARHPIVGFVNADIILLDDFLVAIGAVNGVREKFLVISSRFNCNIAHPLLFESGWGPRLRAQVRADNRMYPAAGSDIFVYPRGLFDDVPPFAIGRGYWDNWLMYRARQNGACLIDATAVITAVHQDHTYDHVAGLPGSAGDDKRVYETGEGRRNLQLAGDAACLFTAFDANEVLTPELDLVSTLRPGLIRRRIKAWVRRKLSISNLSP